MKWLQNRAHKERPNADCLKTVLIVAIAVLGGCSHYVMPTPRIYSSGDQPAFGPLDPKLESNEVDILYVTDRQPATEDPDDPKYGYKRSPSVAYGSAVVALGKYDSWEDLSAYSSRPTRAGESPRLELIRTSEIQRLPSTPYHHQVLDGGNVELDPGDVAAREESVKEFTGEIQRRLALTPRKEVYVFVHGVATKFPRAVENVAQVWHFLGREGVPIAYTWPAGRGGLFFYAYDRESSEFTIFHLKQLAKILAAVPEIEKIHVVAHSRGSDVVLSALRELVIEARAAGTNARDRFKVENVVLLAPDLDFQVTMQRNVAENMGNAFSRLTIYASAEDEALGAAGILFGSRSRLGSTRPDELTEEQRDTLRRQHNLDIIIYQGRLGGSYGHSYAVHSPAVSSDLVALLRFGRPPGKANGRPLKHMGENFWLITDNYMRPRTSP